jgi:hypothetical protein
MDAGCWMPDAGYWILWILDAGYWMLDGVISQLLLIAYFLFSFSSIHAL